MTGSTLPAPRSGWSIRTLLALLGVGLLVPTLLFAGLLLWWIGNLEAERTRTSVLETARRTALAVDRNIGSMLGAMQVLATSANLARGDLEAFHRQAVEASGVLGVNISLRGLDSQQLVNARLPWGTPLPMGSDPGTDRIVIEQRTIAVSDLIVGRVAREPIVVISLPVLRNGQVSYLLSASIDSERLSQILREQGVPVDWVVAAVDRRNVILARNVETERFVGQTATSDLIQNTQGREGVWSGTSRDGKDVIAGYARSRIADWRIAVGGPVTSVRAPIAFSLQYLLMIGIVGVAASILLAMWLSRLVSQPLARLADGSQRLARGEILPFGGSRVREIASLEQSLSDAARAIVERERERDRAAAELQTLNQTLEARVAERTAELSTANVALREEMAGRARSEAQLRQLQKMEAVGQLTGGIAHDFNNMLAVIISSLNLLQRRIAKGDTNVGRFADAALDGAQRAASLTQRLLAFSRQQALSPAVTDVNRLVGTMSELLSRTLGETIRLETVLAGGLWKAHIDPSQLESAILNLAVNARDAMPEGGRLTIETANAYLDDTYAASHGEVTPGQYVLIAVTDTGSGMDADVLAKAFEPFFTTKPVGRGTGLGLSQVYGFVKQSGGHIKIYSEPGHGTTMKLYLPRHAAEGEAATLPALPAGTSTGTETVLVVEDDARVRQMTIEALTDLGYTVLEADGAARALTLIETQPGIALLFTDIVMPEVNGRKLADAALKLRPDLKVLFTTGYTRNAVVHNGVLDHGVQLLGKPFTIQQLAAKVRHVLDGGRDGEG